MLNNRHKHCKQIHCKELLFSRYASKVTMQTLKLVRSIITILHILWINDICMYLPTLQTNTKCTETMEYPFQSNVIRILQYIVVRA